MKRKTCNSSKEFVLHHPYDAGAPDFYQSSLILVQHGFQIEPDYGPGQAPD